MNCPKCGQSSVPDGARFCHECGATILTGPNPAAQIEVTQEVGRIEGGRVVGVDIGQVLGDVSIGNYTLQIGSVHGGVVNLTSPDQQRLPQPRTLPVFLLPRQSTGLLDRKQEITSATTTLQSASPVEFHGPAGIGKTKLLHHLAHDRLTSVFSDGVVYFSAIHHKPVEDLLLDLFDAFYEREATYKPTPVQVRHSLRDERALIILDDVDLERDDVAALMDAAPSCTFLLASTECCLWGDGRAFALQGLPSEDALALVERELGRALTEQERLFTQALCAVLEGHPLRLLQLVALVREDGHTMEDLARQLLARLPAEKTLTEHALAACSEQERRILAVLAAPRGAGLGEQHVSAVTGIEDVAPALDSLHQRKLVQSHSPRYSLAGSLEEALREEWDLTSWNERVLEHFAQWAEQQQQAPERVSEEADAILGILRWALQEERWHEALRLGQAVEGALALGGQWGAWAQVLSWELQAARALGDRTVEAWSLHQSGTRALCLEDTSTAHENLTEALHLRESLEDWEGAAVTRHNLELLGFGGPDGDREPEGDGGSGGDGGGSGWWGSGGGWRGPVLWLGAIGLVSALVVLGFYLLTSPAPFSLTLSPDRIEAGRTSEGTVTLSDPAPPGGVTVELSSSNPEIANVDPSVTIKEGSTTETFIISASSASVSLVSASPGSSTLFQPRLVAFQSTPPGCSVDGDQYYCPPPPPSPDPPPLPPDPPPPPPDPPPPPPDPPPPQLEPPPGPEICGNGIDDDEQGAIDENCEEPRPERPSPPKSPTSPSTKTPLPPAPSAKIPPPPPPKPPPPPPDKQQSVEVTITASWQGMEQSATLTVQTGQTSRSKTETITKTPIAVGLARTVRRSLDR